VDSWRRASHIRWAVEADGLLLVNSATGAVHRLRYPDAAVWDLIGREPSVLSLAYKIGPIAARDPMAAEQYVRRKLKEWADAGWLTAEIERG
jgi:hypothetical protein